MQTRYVTRSKRMADMDYEPDGEDYLARTVMEQEPECVDTGLMDKSGIPIYRQSFMGPIGYVTRD